MTFIAHDRLHKHILVIGLATAKENRHDRTGNPSDRYP